jgi:hypothetical protein
LAKDENRQAYADYSLPTSNPLPPEEGGHVLLSPLIGEAKGEGIDSFSIFS